MQIELKQLFSATTQVDELDVRQMRKALNRLGYYQPYDKVGITEIPDTAIFDTIKSFQREHGMPVTGDVRPNDETLRKINSEIARVPSGTYIWRTVEDGKVRKGHASYNRIVRDWADAPDPGDDFNCRCWAEPYKTVEDIYDPPLEPVYPELLLIPLLRAGRLYNLWKAWFNNKNTDWVLGSHKSEIRWGNQLRNRDWTPEQITETIKYRKRYPAPNKVNPSNPAIRYEKEGRFVVRDEKSKEILQISGDNRFRPNEFGE